jgi:hypothetical protein
VKHAQTNKMTGVNHRFATGRAGYLHNTAAASNTVSFPTEVRGL